MKAIVCILIKEKNVDLSKISVATSNKYISYLLGIFSFGVREKRLAFLLSKDINKVARARDLSINVEYYFVIPFLSRDTISFNLRERKCIFCKL